MNPAEKQLWLQRIAASDGLEEWIALSREIRTLPNSPDRYELKMALERKTVPLTWTAMQDAIAQSEGGPHVEVQINPFDANDPAQVARIMAEFGSLSALAAMQADGPVQRLMQRMAREGRGGVEADFHELAESPELRAFFVRGEEVRLLLRDAAEQWTAACALEGREEYRRLAEASQAVTDDYIGRREAATRGMLPAGGRGGRRHIAALPGRNQAGTALVTLDSFIDAVNTALARPYWTNEERHGLMAMQEWAQALPAVATFRANAVMGEATWVMERGLGHRAMYDIATNPMDLRNQEVFADALEQLMRTGRVVPRRGAEIQDNPQRLLEAARGRLQGLRQGNPGRTRDR